MKKLNLLVLLSIFFMTSFSQSIQRITWENQGTNYDALLFYKNNTDILVHVKYESNGVNKIGKFKAEKVYNPTNAVNDIVIRPTTATKTIFSSNKDLSQYLIPHNFVLLNYNKETNRGDKWIAVNNEELKSSSTKASKTKAGNKFYNDMTDLSNSVKLSSFFTSTDEDYKKLVAGTFFPKNTSKPQAAVASNKTTVHLFLVGDTLDPSIGQDVIYDLKNIRYKMENTLANSPEISLKTTLLAGKDLTGIKVSSSLKGLNIGANDAIIFYYSGHGYNYERRYKKSEFPTMAMLSDDLALEDIHKYIVDTKKPRFSLIMGDMCNATISRRPKHAPDLLMRAGKRPTIDKEDVDRLFKYAKGHILSTSSTYDQYSFSINNSGAFSQSFLDVFDNAIYGMYGESDWKVILKKSYENAYRLTKDFENKNDKWGQYGFMIGGVTY